MTGLLTSELPIQLRTYDVLLASDPVEPVLTAPDSSDPIPVARYESFPRGGHCSDPNQFYSNSGSRIRVAKKGMEGIVATVPGGYEVLVALTGRLCQRCPAIDSCRYGINGRVLKGQIVYFGGGIDIE